MITAECETEAFHKCSRLDLETGEWCDCPCHDMECKTGKRDLIYRTSWDLCDLTVGHTGTHQTYLGAGLALSW